MKRYLIAGNWKMNTNVEQAEALAMNITKSINESRPDVGLLLCPPFTNLTSVSKIIAGTGILLGAQNCYWEEKGAFTGEVSCDMIKSAGCSHVIIGHSERRQFFGETDETVNKKINAALRHGLIPLVCIGETLEQRQNGLTFDILSSQIINGFSGINQQNFSDIVIAYEPVWAIGTGVAATTEQVDEAHNKLRKLLFNEFGDTSKDTMLLYGGSVNAANAEEILKLKNVNGALIGGASLKPDSFIQIYLYANS